MDFEKLRALTVAETAARCQEMIAADKLLAAKTQFESAQAYWKKANENYQATKQVRERFIEEAVKTDAKLEADEYRECP